MNTKHVIETYSGIVFLALIVAGATYYLYQHGGNGSQELAEVENFYNENNFSEANRILDEQLASDRQNVSLLLAKAATLAQEGSLTYREKELGDEARRYAELALDIDPRSAEAYTVLGYTYEIQQNYTEAHKAYDHALQFDIAYAPALAQKAHAYDLQGNVSDATSFYERAAALTRDAKTLAGYARILVLSGDIEKAKTIFAEVIATSVNNRLTAEAYYSLGSLNESKEYSAVAEEQYQKAIQTDPSLAMAYVGLAKELSKKSLIESSSEQSAKDVENSFTYLETALKINPNQSYASLQLAIQTLAMGNKYFAKKVLERLRVNLDNDITLSPQERENILSQVLGLLKEV